MALNPLFYDENFINSVTQKISTKNNGFIGEDIEYHELPFPHYVFKNFINDANFLNSLCNELKTLNYLNKDNDLYRFSQSKDLMTLNSSNLEKLKNTVYQDFRKLVNRITKTPLSDKIDIFAAKYNYSDVLLCHDDQSESRRFAFILYLNPEPWEASYGGLLGLFGLNDQNQPDAIVTEYLPTWNQLVLFEVSDKSFHQVSELKVEGKDRLTVSGWFHGEKPLLLHLPSIYFPVDMVKPLPIQEDCIYDWINPSYLDEKTISRIQQTFCETSEINLTSFLNEDRYEDLIKALDALPDSCWEVKGPRFKRSYMVVNSNLLNIKPLLDGNKQAQDTNIEPSPFDNPNQKISENSLYQQLNEESKKAVNTIRQASTLFGSEAMFLILANMTGLNLHPLSTSADEKPESVNGEEMSGDSHSEGKSTRYSAKRKESIDRRKHKKDSNAMETDSLGKPDDIKTETEIHVEKAIVEEEPKPTDTTKTEGEEDYGTRFHFEVRKFRAGDYTLLNDSSNELDQRSLNLCFYAGCEGWDPEYGGQMVYIDPDEEEPLLCINPYPNSLALVYNDEGLVHFVKYINHKCEKRKTAPTTETSKMDNNKKSKIDNTVDSSPSGKAKECRAFYQIFFNYFESPETRCD